MSRDSVWYDFPPEWTANLRKKLCPPCGKPKSEFDKFMRIYCSAKCRSVYYSKIHIWQDIAAKVLRERGHKCASCGLDNEAAVKKRKEQLDQSITAFIKDNPEKFAALRHEFIREADKLYKEAAELSDEELAERYGHRIGVPSIYSLNFFEITFEVDHIQAIVNGGHPYDESNLQVLCSDCHHKKTAADMALKRQK